MVFSFSVTQQAPRPMSHVASHMFWMAHTPEYTCCSCSASHSSTFACCVTVTTTTTSACERNVPWCACAVSSSIVFLFRTTVKCHGCEFNGLGEKRPQSRIWFRSASETGWPFHPRTARRVLMASRVCICADVTRYARQSSIALGINRCRSDY